MTRNDRKISDCMESIIRRVFSGRISNGAMSFYFCLFPYIEEELCHWVDISYREMEVAGFRTSPNVRRALDELDGVLIKTQIQKGIKTSIRRMALSEIRVDGKRIENLIGGSNER
jgi:hypothetical protein